MSKKFADIPSPTPQQFYASVLFTRLCVIAISLEKLLTTKKTDHWDYASVASLTRNILECYLTFFYLCIDSVSYTYILHLIRALASSERV